MRDNADLRPPVAASMISVLCDLRPLLAAGWFIRAFFIFRRMRFLGGDSF
jgi:hypothetical protein